MNATITGNDVSAPSLFDFDRYAAEGVWEPCVGVNTATPANAIARQQSLTPLHAPQHKLDVNWKQQASDGIAAIRVARNLATQARDAELHEEEILAKFIGFGASDIANHLFRINGAFEPGWEEIGEELESLLTESEITGLKRSRQHAHYTPEFIASALWAGVRRLGFNGGLILEPGCGAGIFMSTAPTDLYTASIFRAIENEPVAASIATALHPTMDVIANDFTKVALAARYDLAIGNPPFSNRRVKAGDPDGRLGLPLHDYFIARSIASLRPGAVAAFVTSHSTMDRHDATARRRIAEHADLVSAFRLPKGLMGSETGTEFVVDILFFRRRDDEAPSNGSAWLDTVPVPTSTKNTIVNKWFATHPECVLGRHAWGTNQNGPTYLCLENPGSDLETDLSNAIATLPANIYRVRSTPLSLTQNDLAFWTGAQEGTYVVDTRDRLCQVDEGILKPLKMRENRSTGLPARKGLIIRRFIAIRDNLWSLLRAQENDQPYEGAQRDLGTTYDAFVAEFGPVNLTEIATQTNADGKIRNIVRRPNLAPYLDDPGCWLVASIEDYDEETRTASKRPIFTERIIHKTQPRTIETPDDALACVLQDKGYVDMEAVGQNIGLDAESAATALGDRVYRIPTNNGTDKWETADEYLSGKVRAKLKVAQSAAVSEPRFLRNVAALELAIPQDLTPSDITARLGAPWIETKDIEAFVKETMGIETTVSHVVHVAAWDIELEPFKNRAQANSVWGTARRDAGALLHDALNSSVPTIYDTYIEDGKEKRVVNPIETESAKDKLQQIKTEFESWIWRDNARTDRLVRIYNDHYNDIVPREFDGSHLELPGASANINAYPNQKRSVWRILSAGSTYLAHAVGAGKTFEIAAAVQSQRRLGFVSKAMIAVPGHCLAQFSREYLQYYPTAKILVADEANFERERRQKFFAAATTGDWDAIIITHSAFKLIPTPVAFERKLIEQFLQDIEHSINENARRNPGSKTGRKRLEARKGKMEAQLEAIRGGTDEMVTIAEMGIDQIIIDEAQNFRKLSFTTNLDNLKGVDPDGSQRAWDLFVKSRFVATKNPRRALIMASGTAITNTLAEMYTLQRYMDFETLRERGLHEFDAWASCFGKETTELELQPSGNYKNVTRFSEFVNVPELVSMFRLFADVVSKNDLREHLTLPSVKGGKREIVTAKRTTAFRNYQAVLEGRISAIEHRKGRVTKGQDILLSVIGDGRHAAIDLRLVDKTQSDEPENKLNLMISNVYRIWNETASNKYSGGNTLGSGQLIFSDLGTFGTQESRGFSAYAWIRERLVELGVPQTEIGFMQHYKKSADRQALFNDFNAGRVRILIGSSETMGTGVNVQKRLVALHHLDVPWLPSQIEQREGRIERQGNENKEIEIYAYATTGSMDATMWQTNERKSRMISMVMSGDIGVRRIEDIGTQANQFALAKAIASGDPRLMRKAGLESEISRMQRLRSAHFDDQYRIQRRILNAESAIRDTRLTIEAIERDITTRIPTHGDAFAMKINGRHFNKRTVANTAIGIALEETMIQARTDRHVTRQIASIGGFDIEAQCTYYGIGSEYNKRDLYIRFTHGDVRVGANVIDSKFGVVTKLENRIESLEAERSAQEDLAIRSKQDLKEYGNRKDREFEFQTELDLKIEELREIEADLMAETKARIEHENRKYASHTSVATPNVVIASDDSEEGEENSDESDTELDTIDEMNFRLEEDAAAA